MEHLFTALCRVAMVDKERNTLSLVDMIEEITIPQEPPEGKSGLPLACYLVTLWERTSDDVPEKFAERISLRSETGESISPDNGSDVDLVNGARARTIRQLPMLPIMGIGRSTFVAEISRDGTTWEEKGRCSFVVRVGATRRTPLDGELDPDE